MRYRRKKFTFAISSPDEFLLQNLKSNMLQLNYFLKVKKLLFCYIHLAAECDINSNNDTILQKYNKSLQSASGSHMNIN